MTVRPSASWKLSPDQQQMLCGVCKQPLGNLEIRNGEAVIVLVDGYQSDSENPNLFAPSGRLRQRHERLRQRATNRFDRDTDARERLAAADYHMDKKHSIWESRRTITQAALKLSIVLCVSCGARNGVK